ncbi:MAG: hypothetical protein HYV26_14775 [Candidatus Hydrogenedentes bacterium]|nr:hypothetical protein [Candidatus Hydrogenedentota bacterium]
MRVGGTWTMRRRALVTLVVGGLLVFSGAASAGDDIQLNSIAPTTGSFLGGTPLSLNVTFNTTGLGAIDVLFSPDASPNPATDPAGIVTDDAGPVLGAITPSVSGPGIFNVYVHAQSGANSNTLPFTFTDEDETEEEAAARTLDDNFEFADQDNNGTISEAEAAALGIDSETFDALDANGDGQVSQDELAADGGGCLRRLGALLEGFSVFGVLAFLLSLLQQLRTSIWGLLFFP